MVPQKKLAWITFLYWFLLLYIVSALIWWFIALVKQADAVTVLRLAQLDPGQPDFLLQQQDALGFKKRKVAQYVGEGSIFFLLIVIGAVFVYRSVRKQLQLAQQQQNFMMAVTHELKTPIAATKLNLETLFKRKLDEEKQKRLLQSAIQETDRLNDLTNNILLASRMEEGKQQFLPERVDIGQLFVAIERSMKNRYPLRSFFLDWKAPDGLSIHGDPVLLKILLSNLIDNAYKYTSANDKVTVAVEESRAGVLLSVADTGQGIPTSEKSLIFDKFYRSGQEKNRETKGTGLGLYLCTKIVKELDGRIWVEDNQPKGAIFWVHVPRKFVLR